MENLVIYKFYIRITDNAANSQWIDVNYEFDDLSAKINSLLPSGPAINWEIQTRKIGKKYIRLENSVYAWNPKIYFWTVKAGKDEDHANEWTSIYSEQPFLGIPSHQMVPFPADAKIFKNYFIWILWRRAERNQDGDWHIIGNVFLLERGKNSLRHEMERLLKMAFNWQRCELKKVITRRRLEEIEDTISALKFTWTIVPSDTFGWLLEDRELNATFTISAWTQARLTATDFLYWKEAVRTFIQDWWRAQVVLETNWDQRTIVPQRSINNNEGGEEESYIVEFDATWRKRAFFTMNDFKRDSRDYLMSHTELIN